MGFGKDCFLNLVVSAGERNIGFHQVLTVDDELPAFRQVNNGVGSLTAIFRIGGVLENEIDFILQHTTDAEDGRKRTDAVINLPKGRKLIIDSKNLMESYIALASADDEIQKAVLSEAHSKSLKNHIKSLSTKEYWRRYEGLDCVILFIPHDGMYHAAIQ